MNKAPKVSVIIPTYNRANFIQRSIQSILNQTYQNFEIIIVDDSTDNTEEKVKEIDDERIIYLKNNRRMGVSKARNMAIEIASGEIIAFQDSDDQWLPEKMEKQVNAIVQGSDRIGAVYCRIIFKDVETGKKMYDNFEIVKGSENFTNGRIITTPSTQTVMVKKSVLNDVGPFDERIKFGEDAELALRISRKYDFAFVNEHLIEVARNHEQLTSDSKAYILGREIIYEKHKGYLSSEILFYTCREISTYYIILDDFKKAKEYLIYALKHKLDIKTFILLSGIIILPNLIRAHYNKKYDGKIPLYVNIDFS